MNAMDRKAERVPTDQLGRRLRIAIVASILINIVGWNAVATLATRPMHVSTRPVEITRVILEKGKITPKIVTKPVIKQHSAPSRKLPPAVVKTRQAEPAPTKPQEHSKVIAAPKIKDAAPDNEPIVPAGGNAQPGKPIEQPTAPQAAKPVSEVKQAEPMPVVVKAPEPVKPKPDPAPPPVIAKVQDPPPVIKHQDLPPVKKGPTKESEPVDEVKPEIPDDLKHSNFKSFVRVKVEIDETGKPSPFLRTSSGNAEIDKRVLEALKKWRWKPALENGSPVASVQLFKFEFLVE